MERGRASGAGQDAARIQLARALPPVRALSVLAEAEEMAPNDPDLPSEQGRIYLQMGDAAQALSSFGRALALNPESPLAINNRGAALLALGQTEAARLDFERALVIDPCQPNALLNLRRMGIDRRCPMAARRLQRLSLLRRDVRFDAKVPPLGQVVTVHFARYNRLHFTRFVRSQPLHFAEKEHSTGPPRFARSFAAITNGGSSAAEWFTTT